MSNSPRPRSRILKGALILGGLVLLHGLSDAPYSLRAMGARLQAEGFLVVGLRVPGHGTCPAALAKVSRKDWIAAVRVAAAGVRERIPRDSPLVLVGYSNGGALSVNHALESLDDSSFAKPGALQVVARTHFEKRVTEQSLDIAWPGGVFSLSHVAVPIPEDDPVYGTPEATAGTGLHFGSLNMHGENGVLEVSSSLAVRMRHNPFYKFAEDRAVAWLRKVLEMKEPPSPL